MDAATESGQSPKNRPPHDDVRALSGDAEREEEAPRHANEDDVQAFFCAYPLDDPDTDVYGLKDVLMEVDQWIDASAPLWRYTDADGNNMLHYYLKHGLLPRNLWHRQYFAFGEEACFALLQPNHKGVNPLCCVLDDEQSTYAGIDLLECFEQGFFPRIRSGDGVASSSARPPQTPHSAELRHVIDASFTAALDYFGTNFCTTFSHHQRWVRYLETHWRTMRLCSPEDCPSDPTDADADKKRQLRNRDTLGQLAREASLAGNIVLLHEVLEAATKTGIATPTPIRRDVVETRYPFIPITHEQVMQQARMQLVSENKPHDDRLPLKYQHVMRMLWNIRCPSGLPRCDCWDVEKFLSRSQRFRNFANTTTTSTNEASTSGVSEPSTSGVSTGEVSETAPDSHHKRQREEEEVSSTEDEPPVKKHHTDAGESSEDHNANGVEAKGVVSV